MNGIRTNYVAILVSAVVYFLVQAVWYTVFKSQYVAALQRSTAEIQQMQQHGNTPLPYFVAFVCNLIFAYVLSWAILRSGSATLIKWALTGAVFAIGFVATSTLTQYMFEQRSVELFEINSGAALVGAILMGAILGAWKKRALVAPTAKASQASI